MHGHLLKCCFQNSQNTKIFELKDRNCKPTLQLKNVPYSLSDFPNPVVCLSNNNGFTIDFAGLGSTENKCLCSFRNFGQIFAKNDAGNRFGLSMHIILMYNTKKGFYIKPNNVILFL